MEKAQHSQCREPHYYIEPNKISEMEEAENRVRAEEEEKEPEIPAGDDNADRQDDK